MRAQAPGQGGAARAERCVGGRVRYVIGRLLWAVVILIGTTAITFAIVFLVPGDPARVVAGPRADAATIASHSARARARSPGVRAIRTLSGTGRPGRPRALVHDAPTGRGDSRTPPARDGAAGGVRARCRDRARARGRVVDRAVRRHVHRSRRAGGVADAAVGARLLARDARALLRRLPLAPAAARRGG